MAEWDSWTNQQWASIGSELRLADPSQVTVAFGRSIPQMEEERWLSPRHRMHSPRAALKKKYPPHDALLSKRIAEYAAVSVPLHVADAWTYFGRAMAAMSMGAGEVAQHLFYYAELRAAQALLSRHGVLVLAGQNFVLGSVETAKVNMPGRVGYNEHQALWVAFESWARMPAASDFVGANLSFAGVALGEWVQERPVSVSLSSVISPLMQGWGLDLRSFSGDRTLRNHLSYDPTRMRLTHLGINPSLVSSLYDQVWSLLDPGAGNPFESLDALISRQAFEALELQGNQDRKLLATNSYRRQNEQWSERVLGESGRYIADALQHPLSVADPEILKLAGRDTSQKILSVRLSAMIGRSLILLRLATGAMRDLMESAGVGQPLVDFWIRDMLDLHGIAVPPDSPTDYAEMYEDVRANLEEIQPLMSLTEPSGLPAMKRDFARPLESLSGFERVAAWSVARGS